MTFASTPVVGISNDKREDLDLFTTSTGFHRLPARSTPIAACLLTVVQHQLSLPWPPGTGALRLLIRGRSQSSAGAAPQFQRFPWTSLAFRSVCFSLMVENPRSSRSPFQAGPGCYVCLGRGAPSPDSFKRLLPTHSAWQCYPEEKY